MYLLYEANRDRLDDLHRQADARRALRPVHRSAAPSQPRAAVRGRGRQPAMLQLTAAVASISLALVLDVKGLLGLGPAIVLAAAVLAAVPAGRAMDRFGRVPVLAAGFGLRAATWFAPAHAPSADAEPRAPGDGRTPS